MNLTYVYVAAAVSIALTISCFWCRCCCAVVFSSIRYTVHTHAHPRLSRIAGPMLSLSLSLLTWNILYFRIVSSSRTRTWRWPLSVCVCMGTRGKRKATNFRLLHFAIVHLSTHFLLILPVCRETMGSRVYSQFASKVKISNLYTLKVQAFGWLCWYPRVYKVWNVL